MHPNCFGPHSAGASHSHRIRIAFASHSRSHRARIAFASRSHRVRIAFASIALSACASETISDDVSGVPISASVGASKSASVFVFEADVHTTQTFVKASTINRSRANAVSQGDAVPGVLPRQSRTSFHIVFTDSGGTVTVRYSAPLTSSPDTVSDDARSVIDWTKLREIIVSSDRKDPTITLANGVVVDGAKSPFKLGDAQRSRFPELSTEQRARQLRGTLRPFLRMRVTSELRTRTLSSARDAASSDSAAGWTPLGADLDVLHSRTFRMQGGGSSPLLAMTIAVTNSRVSGLPTDAHRE